jgi:hypothetical protein
MPWQEDLKRTLAYWRAIETRIGYQVTIGFWSQKMQPRDNETNGLDLSRPKVTSYEYGRAYQEEMEQRLYGVCAIRCSMISKLLFIKS